MRLRTRKAVVGGCIREVAWRMASRRRFRSIWSAAHCPRLLFRARQIQVMVRGGSDSFSDASAAGPWVSCFRSLSPTASYPWD